MPEPVRKGEVALRGIPVSRGVCRGPLFVLARRHALELPAYAIEAGDVPREIQRLENALLATRRQLLEVQRKVSQGIGDQDARILDAQLLVLDDPVLHDEVVKHLRRDLVNVEQAFQQFCQRYLATLDSVDDPYLRERAQDLRDVADRVLHNLLGRDMSTGLSHLREPCILVAFDLTPSQTAGLDRKLVLGFATDQGSETSHTAILARSLQIPAVTGLQNASERLATGQSALLDGYSGRLVVEPTDQTLFEYGQIETRQLAIRGRLSELRAEPTTTLDGVHITLSANIEGPQEIEDIQTHGAEGVGLFRTEYLFLGRAAPPSEEEQLAAYREVAQRLAPAPVIVRTLDLGGDKMFGEPGEPTESNPFLGWRAIRICLQERDLFRAQLRAILRASAHGNVKLMYPMISGLDELNQANALLAQCRQELQAEGLPFNPAMEVGAMIEIPSAVMVAESLARRVNFFSIGTNDLIQYTLAVDRTNPKIAQLYEPTHPAILRLVKATMDAAHAHGLWVGVCGEMAGEAVLAPLLVGLGADELSTAPARVPEVKFILRRLKMDEARELAASSLQEENGQKILARCRDLAAAVAPSLFENDGRL